MLADRVEASPFMEVALRWCARGFSVVPIQPGSKLPLIKWRALIDTPLTEGQIREIWQQHPTANIGVIPASGKMLVVDADVYKSSEVIQNFADTILDYGVDLPGGVVADTANGGVHVWLAWPPGVDHCKSAADALGVGIDVKSSGGYVLVPGSVVNGRRYRWRDGQSIEECPIVALASMSMIKAIGQAAPVVDAPVVEMAAPASGLMEAYKRTDGRELVMAKAVFHVGKLMLEECGNVDDVQQWFDRAWSRFFDQVRQREGRSLEQDGRGPDDLWAKIRSTKSKLDLEAVRPGNPGENTGKNQTDAEVYPPNILPLPLEFWGEGDDIDPPRDFVEGMLIEETLSLWFGESNTGKTFVLFDLACHVALGRDWFGKQCDAGGVVYIAAEGAGSLRKRRRAWQTRYEVGNVALAVIPSSVDFRSADSDDVERVIAACRVAAETMDVPVKLIVIDTLSRAIAGGNENAPEDMTAFIKAVDRIKGEVGAHVASIHHSGKDTSKGARGHSSLRAAVDSEFEIVKISEELGIVKTAKQRDMEMGGDLGFKLEVVSVGEDQRGKPITSCVVVPVEVSPRQEKLNDRQRSIVTILANLLNADGRVPMKESIQVDGVTVWARDAVKRDLVRAAFVSEERKTGRGDGQGDAAPTDVEKKAFGRSVKTLEKVRKIVSDQKFMTFYDLVDTS